MARVLDLGLLGVGLLCASCNSGLAYYGSQKKEPDPIIDPTVPATSGTTPGTTETDTPTGPTTTGPDTGTPTTPTTPTTTTPTDTGDPVPTGPWANGDPDLPPPYNVPPSVTGTDCAAVGGILAGLDDDEVSAESYDGPLESRTLTSPVSGWYDLYSHEMSHEEAGEWNESAMVRISNLVNPTGLPALSNCESNWVTVDPDNYVDPGDALLYMGTFWLEPGANELQLEHLCPRVRLGGCMELEFLDDPDTTCTSGDGNSAHLDGNRLCLVEATP